MQGYSSDNRSSIDGVDEFYVTEEENSIITDMFWQPLNGPIQSFIQSLETHMSGMEAAQHYFFRDPTAHFNQFYNRVRYLTVRYSNEEADISHDDQVHYDLDSEIALMEHGGSVCYHDKQKFYNEHQQQQPVSHTFTCSSNSNSNRMRAKPFEIKVSCSGLFFTTNTTVQLPQLQNEGETLPFVYSKLQREDTSYDQFHGERSLQNIDSNVAVPHPETKENIYVRQCYSALYLKLVTLRDKIQWHHWLNLCGLILVSLMCLGIRCMIASNNVSGWNNAPKYGDYEAQRHWMEITYNLPLSQWYVDGPNNDLQYWGLDYPPLSAYWAYLCATVASYIEPDMIALYTSRGYMNDVSKFFMRCSVILVDFVVFFPAQGGVINILYKRYRVSSRVLVWYTCSFTPVLLLVDHGHFQYNSFAVGLTQYAVQCILKSHWVQGCVFFTASMMFKQTAMYYAPAFFGVLLGLALKSRVLTVTSKEEGGAVVKNTKTLIILNNDENNPTSIISPPTHKRPHQTKQSWTSYVSEHKIATDDTPKISPTCMKYVCLFGITVLTTVVLIFLPFLLSDTGMTPVIQRMFPFKRGIFEDKVANFWCVSHILIKWKTLFTDSQMAL